MTTISVEAAEDCLYDLDAIIQTVSEHRWYTKQLVVFETTRTGGRGFYYLKPKTEDQEGQDTFEADPVPTFPVRPREVTTTVYERVE